MPQNMLPTDLVFFTKCLLFFFAFRYGVFYNGNFPVSYAVFLFFFALNFKLFSIANENSHVQIECMVVSKGFMALQIFVQ